MKTVKRLTAAAAGLALVTTLSGTAAATAAAPAAGPQLFSVLTLSGDDNGRTVQAHSGDVIQLSLYGFPDHTVRWLWVTPWATAPSVLSQTSGSESPNGDAQATFTAAAAGTGDIATYARCVVVERGSVCPPWVGRWKVTVVVS
ncbi:hypothetical protein ACWDRR_31355 [Kitasatospora sp. NPDC003701]